MCDGIVIDAHIIRSARDEIVLSSGPLYELICWITQNCGIAITQYIEKHWKNHCGDRTPSIFWEWYTDQAKIGSIKIIKPKQLDINILNKIRKKYGLPKDPFVIAYIECADATSEPRYILSEDMDLHAPKAKSVSPKTQASIREGRTGPLCCYLERRLCVRVGTVADCKSHFSTDQGQCHRGVTTVQGKCPHMPHC
jgi:hypothetical protein